ncbi:MAG: hypothetical protein M3Z95_01800 [Actinomycetota bacterium]|nr:hypothetical protein [Actinomycetota bacterium]
MLSAAPHSGAIPKAILRVALLGLLGLAAPVLGACGETNAGLIPTANATPLQGDFEEVALAARSGNCTATKTALAKTEQDFGMLPSSVDAGLRKRLAEGVTKLHKDALELCAQPLAPTTATSSTPTPTTTSRTTPTNPPATQPTTPPPTAAPSPGGGTPAPEAEGNEAEAVGAAGGTGRKEHDREAKKHGDGAPESGK